MTANGDPGAGVEKPSLQKQTQQLAEGTADEPEVASAAAAAAAAPGAAPDAATSKKKKKKKKKKAPDVVLYTDNGTFRVTHSAAAGRCVVAARDIEPGELILDEAPFAKVVRRDCAIRHCASCCRQIHEAARIEADAPYAAYCCRTCKTQEGALRSAEASAIGKLAGISAARDVDLDLLRMVLRLLVTRAKVLGLRPDDADGKEAGQIGSQEQEGAEETVEGTFLLQQWRNLLSLMHHREAMPSEWIGVVRAAAEDLMEVIPAWARSGVEEAVELACRVNVNAHGLRDDSGSNLVIGVGLFPLTAMINHACRPNCTFVYYAGKMEVRALERVTAGAELTVYYIDLLQSTAERRRDLLASKHFLCTCSRCEYPEPADAYLDGVCCVDCGQDGCLTSTPPLRPEDALAAQLAQLGEDLAGPTPPSKGPGGTGKGKKKKKDGQQRVDVNGTATVASNGRGSSLTPPGPSGDDGVLYCSSCGRQYPAKVVEEGVVRAKAIWDAAMAVLRAKDFLMARRTLEKWLEDFDAGSLVPPAALKKKAAKKGRVKLHPANSLVVQTLVPLANCCNFEEDYSASARYLRRAISAMDTVYPANYPELGDFYAALADALTSFLAKRGEALPKKSRSQAASERKNALEKAAAIRSVCLGAEHPTTRESMRALARG